MRYILLLLIGCLVSQAISRPAPVDESEEEEIEYENEAEGPEGYDSLEKDDESRVGPQETAVDDEEPEKNQRLQESNRNTYLQRRSDEQLTRENSENFLSQSGRNGARESEALSKRNSNELHLTPEQHDASRYMEKPETNEPAEADRQFTGHMDNSKYSDEQTPIDKRTLASNTVSDEEDDLFENNGSPQDRQGKGSKSGYSEAVHSNEQSRYSRKYYNPIHEGVPNKIRYDNHINLDRDRRALQETNETVRSEPDIRENLEQSSAEDEEAAIKRHVKKLSPSELDELLGSLSDDKRELLKKIMDNDFESSYDINKREITKKEGAAPDENTYLEGGGLSDNSKLQESVGSGGNSQAQSSEATESSKLPNPQASDITILPVTKSSETSNDSSSPSSLISETKDLSSSEISHPADNNDNNAPIADSNNQAKIDANQEPSKAESKRETNSDDLTNIEKSMDEDDAKFDSDVRFVDSQEFSNELSYDDVAETNNKNENIMKRDTYSESENDIAESVKSLEESFPNSNSYDDEDPYSGSDMAPLVRVKRKNSDLVVKKRAAGVLPDAKVAFCPYRAENDDEDNDEGNEFDDNGFYDRTSNLAKSHLKAVSAAETPNNFEDSSLQLNSDEKVSQITSLNQQKLPQLKGVVKGDTTSLGSDTDSVLSGVEGVDENLMFNSASRNKRSAAETHTANDDRVPKKSEENLNRPLRSTPVSDDGIKYANGNSGALNYHENDAFGALPRNYEGDLGRYKRVRHVKQLPASEDVPSSSA